MLSLLKYLVSVAISISESVFLHMLLKLNWEFILPYSILFPHVKLSYFG